MPGTAGPFRTTQEGRDNMRRRHLSAHYRFFYTAGSVAERDIDDIVSRQEECFRLICQALDVEPQRPIRYYLCDTGDEVGRLYGDDEPANGCTKLPDKIFAVYNETMRCLGFHEDAHMISYLTIARPGQKLLREGLAQYFERLWWGLPNEAWARYWLFGGSAYRVTDLATNALFDAAGEMVSYPIAGVFAQRLIHLGGMARFKELYRTAGADLAPALRHLYGSTIDGIENDMVGELRMMRFDPCIMHRMDELHAEPRTPDTIAGSSPTGAKRTSVSH